MGASSRSSSFIIHRSSFLQYRQVLFPGADRFGVLPAHHADDLRDVTQVVRDPRGKQLAERDAAEFGMRAAPVQLIGRDLQLRKPREARFAALSELKITPDQLN